MLNKDGMVNPTAYPISPGVVDTFDVEYSHPPSYMVDDKTIYDVEQSSSLLRENQPTTTSSRLTRTTRRCIVLSVLGLAAWGIATYTLPSRETPSLLEQATSVKNAIFNSRTPTANLISVANVANNAAFNLNFSSAIPENSTFSTSLETRSFPRTIYCDSNYDCDWNQICSDGICKAGCQSTDDCHRPHKCKKGWCEYRDKICELLPCGRKCLGVSYICSRKNQCCSQMCRKTATSMGYKVCIEGSRQEMVGAGDGDEEEEEEEDVEE